jgi:hypothetical protein
MKTNHIIWRGLSKSVSITVVEVYEVLWYSLLRVRVPKDSERTRVRLLLVPYCACTQTDVTHTFVGFMRHQLSFRGSYGRQHCFQITSQQTCMHFLHGGRYRWLKLFHTWEMIRTLGLLTMLAWYFTYIFYIRTFFYILRLV